jgi:SET domain-containing protein
MTKPEFMTILKPDCYGGIGVFAVVNIPAGTDLTPVLNANFDRDDTVRNLIDVPDIFRKYVVYQEDGSCIAPRAFNAMESGWYLNHSETPNVNLLLSRFTAACDIAAGAELTIDYATLDEPHDLREEFYRVA